MLPEWNLKVDTRRHSSSSDYGARWQPEGEIDPASGIMPAFAKRRKGKAAETTQRDEAPGLTVLRRYE